MKNNPKGKQTKIMKHSVHKYENTDGQQIQEMLFNFCSNNKKKKKVTVKYFALHYHSELANSLNKISYS